MTDIPVGSPDKGYSAFISHASADHEAAAELAASLESKGLSCWIAPRNVRPGAEYAEEIIRGINHSKCFVLVLSEAANLSGHVRREVERAASKGKPIDPVRIEDVPPSPKLEFFVSMHHWLDAWDGVLSDHAVRLAAAINSEEQWIGNRVVRRRRWISGGVATLVAATLLAVAMIFGGDIRRQMLDPAERARQDLQAAGVSVDAEGLAGAIGAADAERLALFRAAEIAPAAIVRAFSRPDVAEGFFRGSKANPAAIKWFKSVLEDSLDPNLPIPHDYYERHGILRLALSAGNFDAAMTLLEAGASPHVFQNLWFTWHSLPMAVFPYSYVDRYSGFTEEQKGELARAFAEAGAVISIDDSQPGQRRSLQLAEMEKTRNLIKTRHGVDIPNIASICEAGATRVCRAASARTGFDWCAFADELPAAISSEDSDYYDFRDVRLIQLVNVVDGKAYVLASLPSGFYPGFGLAEISKDMKTWYVYKYVTPMVGMGHCKKDDSGFARDDCWRRVEFEQTEDKNVLKMFDYYDYTKMECS